MQRGSGSQGVQDTFSFSSFRLAPANTPDPKQAFPGIGIVVCGRRRIGQGILGLLGLKAVNFW